MTVWTDLTGLEFSVSSVDVGGVPTRSLQAGSGPPLVFLHGTSGHLDGFSRNIAAHAEHFTVHAIDMLGHGYTGKPDRPYTIPTYVEHLLGYLDACGLESAHLAGQSLGGWVAAWAAAEHPDRVRSLSLLAIRHAIYQQPEMKRNVGNILVLQDLDIRTQNLMTEERLGRIQAPSLVVWTTDDPTSEIAEGHFWADSIPGSRFELIEDAGHWPHYEQADRFNALHLDFLLSTLP
jgi:2-hydroxy-6-oxonona-2,4-dienedioate hydrolase